MERNKERSGDIIIKVIKWTQNEIGRETRIGSHVTNEIKSNNDKKKIMKQFNLEEYKKNPSRKVVTRDGRPVRIICTDAKNDYPVIGLVDYDEQGELLFFYKPDGTCVVDFESKIDLFFAPEKKVIWGNLYSTQHGTTFSGDFYETKEEAIMEKAKDFSKYITTFKVEWEE